MKIVTPHELFLDEHILVVPLSKAWSDEARAAAIAARQAKSQGKDPKAAAEAAKALVREGATPKEAAAQAVKGGGSAGKGGGSAGKGGGGEEAGVGSGDFEETEDYKSSTHGDGKYHTTVANDPVSKAFEADRDEGKAPDRDLKKYDGTTSTSSDYDPEEDGIDPMHYPASTVAAAGNKVQIQSDWGDESMYGDEVWEKTDDGGMKLLRSWGRDTHDENLADRLRVKIGETIPRNKWDAGLTRHMSEWREKGEKVTRAKKAENE